MTTEDETREQGVEFGPLTEELKEESYPQEKSALLDEYGERAIELEDGEQTLDQILGPLGETTYNSAEDVMQDVIGNVSQEAIGRENYTDRGGGPPGEEDHDEESL
jgi:hypothetical protein